MSLTMVLTSVITLMPALKVSVGMFWNIFLIVFWFLVFGVTFYGEKLFPSKKFPLWAQITFPILFMVIGWITSNGAAGSGTLYVSMLDDRHILVSLFGKENGWKLVSYLYSLSLSSMFLIFSRVIWTTRNKFDI